jgi:hypothetical protein
MKTIEEKIREDIPSPLSSIDVLDTIVYRPAVKYDEERLMGYSFSQGDYFVTTGSASYIYRPVTTDFRRVWGNEE